MSGEERRGEKDGRETLVRKAEEGWKRAEREREREWQQAA